MRAIAAFLVFFHHHPTTALVIGPLRLWREMHVGVTLFFVLSGLVITWRYDDPADDRIRPIGTYFLNRFARIYPLYLVLVIPTLLLRHQTSGLMWFLNLTLFKGFSDTYKLAGIGQSWSLTVEECFYATAPLLFLVWRRSKPLAFGIALAVLAALLSLATVPALAAIFGPPRFVLLYTYFGRFFEFFVGVWLAKRLSGWRPVAARRSPALPGWTLAGGAGIIGVIFALAALGRADPLSYGLYAPPGIALNNVVLPFFIAALYWGLVTEPSWIRSVLSTRLGGLLGRSSYAFYLIHQGAVLVAITGLLVSASALLGAGAAGAAKSFLAAPAGLFLFVVLLSFALYELIEHPANRLIRRWGSPPSTAKPGPPPRDDESGSPAPGPTVRTA